MTLSNKFRKKFTTKKGIFAFFTQLIAKSTLSFGTPYVLSALGFATPLFLQGETKTDPELEKKIRDKKEELNELEKENLKQTVKSQIAKLFNLSQYNNKISKGIDKLFNKEVLTYESKIEKQLIKLNENVNSEELKTILFKWKNGIQLTKNEHVILSKTAIYKKYTKKTKISIHAGLLFITSWLFFKIIEYYTGINFNPLSYLPILDGVF